MSRVLLLIALVPASVRGDDAVLRFLPSDTKVVLTIHVPSLGDSEKKHGTEVIRRLYLRQLAPELDRDVKLPFSDLTSITIAQPHAGTLTGTIVVRGKVDAGLLYKQLGEAARTSKRQLSVEKMGKPAVAVYRRRLDEARLVELFPMLGVIPPVARKVVAPREVYVAALDGGTLLVSSSPASMRRALAARPAKTPPRTSDELTELLKKQDPKDVASFAMTDDALLPALLLLVDEETKETFEQFTHLTVRVQGGKPVRVTLMANGKSDDLGATLQKKARATLANIRKGLPRAIKDEGRRKALDEMFGSFRVSRKGAVVTLAGQLSEEGVRALTTPAAK